MICQVYTSTTIIAETEDDAGSFVATGEAVNDRCVVYAFIDARVRVQTKDFAGCSSYDYSHNCTHPNIFNRKEKAGAWGFLWNSKSAQLSAPALVGG